MVRWRDKIITANGTRLKCRFNALLADVMLVRRAFERGAVKYFKLNFCEGINN